MSWLYGALGLEESEAKRLVNNMGQRTVYDATQEHLERYNAELDRIKSVFVEEVTEDFSIWFDMPSGGRLQRGGGQARRAAVRAVGGWDVNLPLYDFGDALSVDRVSLAYLTLRDYQKHVDTIAARNTNTVRHEIFRALFNNQQRTFADPLRRQGALIIYPLANGDDVVYPPKISNENSEQENHYLLFGYNTLTDTNNPFPSIVRHLTEHFGETEGGEAVAVFVGEKFASETELLASFVEVPDRYVRLGDNVSTPTSLPNVPGRVLGRCDGAWIVKWDWVPANYMLALHLEVDKPLYERVDKQSTGLPRGLTLVAEDEIYPFKTAHWTNRFGFGVANRLNGVCAEFSTVAAKSYATPMQFSI